MVFVVSGLYTAIPLYQIYISSSSFLSEVPSLWLAIRAFMSLMDLVFALSTVSFLTFATGHLGAALTFYLLSFASVAVIGVIGSRIPETIFLQSNNEFIRNNFRSIQFCQYGEAIVPFLIVLCPFRTFSVI